MRSLLDTHVDLLALLLAESGVQKEEQVTRLDTLIRCVESKSLEDTLFDGGRRVAFTLDEDTSPPKLELNAELLERVDDDEILFALAAPIAKILGLSQLGVAITLQTREERQFRNLMTKASRRLDVAPVRATDVPAFIHIKMRIFAERLGAVTAKIGHAASFEIHVDQELLEGLEDKPGWPEFADMASVPVLLEARNRFAGALAESKYARSVDTFVELVWDSLGVSPQSFFRNAARALRAENVGDLVEALSALEAAISSTDLSFSASLADWSSYSEVYDAWRGLLRVEKSLFGISTRDPDRGAVSVLEPARDAFGLDDPPSLPWADPLVSWTVREVGALRDLFAGSAQTMPGAPTQEFVTFEELHRQEEQPLELDSNRASVSIQMLSVGSDVVPTDRLLEARAYSATLHTLLSQFDQLPQQHRVEAVRMLRRSYDEYFPAEKMVWSRRFKNLQKLEPFEAFMALSSELTRVFNLPVLFDPIVKPSVAELAPFPTLTFVLAMTPETEERTPFWIPFAALTSTSGGAPLRLRVVAAPADPGAQCGWICDRTLALDKLEGQPLDLVAQSVHGDCLHFAINP